MKKSIYTLPKKIFDEYFIDSELDTNACHISILDCDNNEDKYIKLLGKDNFLQVKMWDIEKDIYDENGNLKYSKPSNEELLKIVLFINEHRDKTKFIIHCSAGISRSGAVARYIKNKFYNDVDIELYNKVNKHNLPNLYILKKLKELDK